MAEQAQPIAATLSAVGRHLQISRERVRQLIAERVFEPLADGRLDLDGARGAYIRHLRDRPARSAAGDRLREARAREVEQRMAERAHRLVDVNEMLAAFDRVIGVIVMGMDSMPARIGGRDLTLRSRVDSEIVRVRTEAADWLTAQSKALRTTGRAAIGLDHPKREELADG